MSLSKPEDLLEQAASVGKASDLNLGGTVLETRPGLNHGICICLVLPQNFKIIITNGLRLIPSFSI
jgi:hypothetical protein